MNFSHLVYFSELPPQGRARVLADCESKMSAGWRKRAIVSQYRQVEGIALHHRHISHLMPPTLWADTTWLERAAALALATDRTAVAA